MVLNNREEAIETNPKQYKFFSAVLFLTGRKRCPGQKRAF
jgi:hypothetical protein